MKKIIAVIIVAVMLVTGCDSWKDVGGRGVIGSEVIETSVVETGVYSSIKKTFIRTLDSDWGKPIVASLSFVPFVIAVTILLYVNRDSISVQQINKRMDNIEVLGEKLRNEINLGYLLIEKVGEFLQAIGDRTDRHEDALHLHDRNTRIFNKNTEIFGDKIREQGAIIVSFRNRLEAFEKELKSKRGVGGTYNDTKLVNEITGLKRTIGQIEQQLSALIKK